MKAVHRIDAIVMNRLRDDAGAMAAWKSARHVERPAHVKKTGAATATPGDDGELVNPSIGSASPTR